MGEVRCVSAILSHGAFGLARSTGQEVVIGRNEASVWTISSWVLGIVNFL